ncbi:MAG: hypothetical protein KatS3mg055_3697 [Chloroflexus sp.]|uniref:NYN domain-containing protein n=1 Tax=Chloroflexus sp. TaxID=1904827 RepID=UPI0021DC3506|nr:NYN domain-containing protein [Chloroflexus sp.]GIV91179.1 MAG: hypothetical protein KatS3mg055_3697 [Chloroflexus sp.]
MPSPLSSFLLQRCIPPVRNLLMAIYGRRATATGATAPRSTTAPRRIALLIDGENCAATYADQVMELADKQGILVIRRVYANWSVSAHQKWIEAVARYDLRPIYYAGIAPGKSTIDMVLTIDAMDLHYRQVCDDFCLVTGDGDYAPLVKRLRAGGANVIVIGMEQTATVLKEVCSTFIPLAKSNTGTSSAPPSVVTEREQTTQSSNTPALISTTESTTAVRSSSSPTTSAVTNGDSPIPQPTTAQSTNQLQLNSQLVISRPLRDAVKLLQRILTESAQAAPGEWVSGSTIGLRLRAIDPSFDHRFYGYQNLSKLLDACVVEAKGVFEIRRLDNGTIAIRLKPSNSKSANDAGQAAG